jgi:valyl-tRNA synthetase
VKITPERYAKGYLDWLAEKRDWPIGRQLWWGHRIPVWTKNFSNAREKAAIEEEAVQLAGAQTDLDNIESEVHSSFIHTWDPNTSSGTAYWCLRDETDRPGIEAAGYKQVEDVLDTWFSSALWPHSTLGWPDDTPELKTFYPTSVLVTTRDIITLWVARMVLAGLYNTRQVPFHEVYITPKILDGYGETMSKSKGNGVDPLDVIEKFGADALRFGLAYLTTDTQDVKMPVEFECPHCGAQFPQTKKNRQLPRIECEKCGQPFSTQWAEKPEDKALPRGAVVSERFELGRNFANKLWNAARFSLINLAGYAAPGSAGGYSDGDLLLEDRWLLSRLATVTQQVTGALERYRYADAARTLYDFAWNEFCSFYVEMTKARFTVAEQRQTAQRVLAHALDVLMRLLHPMMPFLTEEVWQMLAKVAPRRGLGEAASAAMESICIAPWPQADTARQNATIEEQFADFQAVLGAVREIRQRQNIPPREELAFAVRCDTRTAELLQPMQPYFAQMARATAKAWGPEAATPDIAASVTLAGRHGTIEVHVDLARFIDVAAERQRLEKERENLNKQIGGIETKLANKNFVDRAPAELVQQQRNKLNELCTQLKSIESALANLPK